MCDIVPVETLDFREDCGRFLKRDTVLLEIGNGLRDVSRKHICVYTLTYPTSQELRGRKKLEAGGWRLEAAGKVEAKVEVEPKIRGSPPSPAKP
jgi:hypothetical protein